MSDTYGLMDVAREHFWTGSGFLPVGWGCDQAEVPRFATATAAREEAARQRQRGCHPRVQQIKLLAPRQRQENPCNGQRSPAEARTSKELPMPSTDHLRLGARHSPGPNGYHFQSQHSLDDPARFRSTAMSQENSNTMMDGISHYANLEWEEYSNGAEPAAFQPQIALVMGFRFGTAFGLALSPSEPQLVKKFRKRYRDGRSDRRPAWTGAALAGWCDFSDAAWLGLVTGTALHWPGVRGYCHPCR